MATVASTLQLRGLGKQAMAALAIKAKRLGKTPERYLRDLVREDLALDRKARTTTLAELWSPDTKVDDAELDELVEAARTRHHRRTVRRK